MSVTATRAIACRACGHDVDGLTIESANPTRHPWFQDKLLDRTLLRMPCPRCGAEHVHLHRFVWTDLPGCLCACVLREEERADWPSLETETLAVLSVPLREEGPLFVRDWGRRVAIRAVFGLEELREKVLCRVHDLDDRVVESLKLTTLADPAARLETAKTGGPLTFRTSTGTVEIDAAAYGDSAARREDLARAYPALFAEESAWINALRASPAA